MAHKYKKVSKQQLEQLEAVPNLHKVWLRERAKLLEKYSSAEKKLVLDV